jgi:hypothetical protein
LSVPRLAEKDLGIVTQPAAGLATWVLPATALVRNPDGVTQESADLTIRARVPGHYERPGELLDVSAAEYAALFPLR